MRVPSGPSRRTSFVWLFVFSLVAFVLPLARAQAPSFTTRPFSRIATAGQTVSLAVTASGGQPLTYAWRRNGQLIAGATSATHTLTSASLSDRGSYEVSVTNSSGVARTTFGLIVSSGAVTGGRVEAWGYNEYGEITTPANVGALVAVSAGWYHSVGLRADGTVVAWGWNESGRANVPPGLSGVVAISAGITHTLALKGDGTVVAWGTNEYGQTAVPSGLTGVVAISAGATHSLALKADGTVIAWGAYNHTAMQPATVLPGLSRVIAISAGIGHNLVLKGDGTVASWGDSTATQQYGVATIPAGLGNVVAISAGGGHNVALKADGTLATWGFDANGQVSGPQGQTNVVLIAAGGYHTVIARSDGTVAAWGNNYYAQSTISPYLRNLESLSASFAHNLALTSGPSAAPVFTTRPLSQVVTAGSIVSISAEVAGAEPVTYQWKRNGQTISGATYSFLQIGNVALSDRGFYQVVASSPYGEARSVFMLNVVAADCTVGAWPAAKRPPTLLANVAEVSAGPGRNVAVTTTGGVSVWDDGATSYLANPPGLSGIVGAAAGAEHCVAVTAGGTVIAWGSNSLGQTAVPAGLTNIVAVAAGTSHCLALRADGKLFAWGDNTNDQGAVPVDATDGVLIAAGSNHNVVMRADGTVLEWGRVSYGFIKTPNAQRRGFAAGSAFSLWLATDGSVSATDYGYYTAAAIVPTGLSGVIAVAAGETHSVALKFDGSVVSWGNATNGLTAVPPGMANVQSISAGKSGTLVVQPSVANVFTVQPADQVATAGTRITINARATGLPPLTFQWKKGDVALVDGAGISGTTTPTLVIDSATTAAAGDYVLVVTSLTGSITSRVVKLTVHTPPSITSRPLNRLVSVGQPVTLTVTATDPGPLTYQWRRNGRAIAGATAATYSIASATLADRGTYEVVVSNANSSVRSVLMLNVSSVPLASPMLAAWGGVNSAAYYQTLLPPTETNVVRLTPFAGIRADGTIAPWDLQWSVPAGLGEVIDVSVGAQHALALRADGTVVAWGLVSTNPPWNPAPTGLRDVVAILAGTYYDYAVKSDGTVVAWNMPYATGPAPIPDGLTDVIALTRGAGVLALKADGTVVSWEAEPAPVPAGLNGVIAIASSYSVHLALKADGTVVAWGSNLNQQKDVPVGLTNVVAISASETHALALRSDGTVVTWGNLGSEKALPAGLQNVAAAVAGIPHDVFLANAAAPAFLTHPTGKTINVGHDATFTGSARGIPFPTYRWKKGPTALSDGTNLSGSATTSLALTNAQLADSGDYTLVATNSVGSATSSAATLVVAAPPEFTVRPRSQQRLLGEAATLSAGVAAGVGHVYQWRRNGQVIAGATTPTLHLPALTLADRGFYELTVTNAAGGVAHAYLHLAVAKPNQTVRAWSSAGVARSVGGLTGARNVVAIAAGSSHNLALLNDGTVHAWFDPANAGADYGQATVPAGLESVVAIAAGRLRSLALLADGTVREWGLDSTGEAVPAGLTDVIAIALYDRFSIAVRSDGTVVNWGGAFALGALGTLRNVVSFAPGPTFGVALKSDGTVAGWGSTNNGALSFPAGLDRVVALATSDYHVLARRADGTVVAWGSSGAGSTIPAGLDNVVAFSAGTARSSFVRADGSIVLLPTSEVVLPGLGSASAIASAADRTLALVDALAPTIVTEPADLAVTAGQTATFTVAATGAPTLAYEWSKDGVLLAGATTATFSVYNVQLTNSGRYSVKISNSFGSVVSRAAYLGGPNPPPTITVQPQTATVLAGATTSLSVTATGIGALAYQWRRNGVPIAGGTSATLSFDRVTFAAGATYDVLINDGLSLVGSAPSLLTVAPASYPEVVGPVAAFNPSFEVAGGYPGGFYRLASGKVIVFGSFSRINGNVARNVARLNVNGTLDPTFVGSLMDGTVYAVVAQADGKLVIGGVFSRVAGRSRAGLARLHADGTLDESFAPSGSYFGVYALGVQADGKLVVGGGFSAALARVGPDGSADASFAAPAPNGAINALAVQGDGKIIAAGGFTSIAGQTRNRVARLNSDGSLDTNFSIGTGFNGSVYALRLMEGSNILLGGAFTTFAGASANRIVRLTPEGSVDPDFLPGNGFNSTVYALDVQSDGRILAGGAFGGFGSTQRLAVARLYADGTLDTSFVPLTFQYAVIAIGYLDDGSVLVGGGFSTLGTSTAQFGIARLLPTGTAVVSSFGPGLLSPGSVSRVLAVSEGKAIVAGTFTHVNGAPRGFLAGVNADGSLDTFYNAGAGANDAVNDAAINPDGSVVLAGAFTTISGYPRVRHARMLPGGSIDGTFGATVGPDVAPTRLAVLPDGRVLLLGSAITRYDYRSTPSLVLVAGNGSVDTTFSASPGPADGAVMAAAVQRDSKLLVVGSFGTFSGKATARIVRLLTTGTVDASFSPDVDDTIRAVAVQADGKILIAGDFLLVNHVPRSRVARLNADGTLDPTFNPNFSLNDSPSLLLPQADGRVLLGGAFTGVGNNAAMSYLIRLRADGGLDPSFCAPGLSAAPTDVAVGEDGALLIAGGEFSWNGLPRMGLARTATTAGPSILAQPVGSAVLAGAPLSLSASVAGGRDATYQWIRNGVPITGATSPLFSIAAAQVDDAGTYRLRVSYAGGTLDSATVTVSVAASAPVLNPVANTVSGFGGAIKAGSRWPLAAPVPTVGTAPISYQWTHDGEPIVGATNRTYLPTTWQEAAAGAYRVTLGNSVGSVTSTPFAQAVTPTLDWEWRAPDAQGNSLVNAVFLNGRFLAGGVRGTILTSTDGESWTNIRLGVSQTVLGFAFGQATYVALSSFGSLWTSSDALQWTQREVGGGTEGNYLNAIAFGLGRFVAVGGGGLVATSTDGLRWSSTNAATGEPFSAVAFGGGKFVALGAAGRTYFSSDGANWTAGATLVRPVSLLAYGAGKFVAAGDRHVFFSADGLTWTRAPLLNAVALRSLQYTSDGFLALLNSTDGKYLVSPDANTWTTEQVSFGGSATTLLTATPSALTAGAGRKVIVGAAPETMIYTKPGQNWVRVGPYTALGFAAVAADSTSLMIVTSDGKSYRITPNTSASLAQAGNVIFNSAVTDVAFGAGVFVAVAVQGGISTYNSEWNYWMSRASNTNRDLKGVSFALDRFFAAGVNGTLLVSTDGASWSPVVSGTTQTLTKVAYGGTFVAVGANGTVIGSTDGSNWSPRSVTGISSTISDVVFAAGKFVLISEGGSIRTSPDGQTWTARVNPLGAGFKTLAYAGGKFFAFTTGNTNYLVSTDAVTWTAAQHGNANTTGDAVVLGDRLYLVAANTSIVSLQLNVPAPILAAAPSSQTLVFGGTGSLGVTATGPGPFAYQWFKDGTALIGANFATLALANISDSDAGSYTVAVTNAGGTTTSAPAVVTIESRGLLNSAARANVGTGSAALTGVFSVEGSGSKQMLLRAVGPALASIGISGTLVDPQLVVEDLSTGATVASNDDWGTAANAVQTASTAALVGAMPFAAGSKDAAVLATFAPGAYRVRVVGAGATTGVASLEIYDADSTPRLVYLGTRARVGAGGDALVQGFTLAAVSPGRSYLIRALGPSLGLPGALSDPQLAVFSGATPLASNDNAGGDAALAALAASVGAMPLPAAGKDAAVQITPTSAGVLTVQVSGVGGATGLALLEIFEADAQRAASVPLAVVSAPENISINAGQPATFGVVTVAKPGATYQWSKNGVPLAGATQNLLSFPRAQASDAGTYGVFVRNGGATAFNSTATLTVAAVNNAAHGALGGGYTPGGAVTITNTLHFVGSPTALEWTTTLPAGWTLLADGGAIGDVRPAINAGGAVTWRWTAPPPSPVTFTYTVAAPATESVARALVATASVTSGGAPQTIAVAPAALTLRPVHTADADGDGRVGLLELTRVIELYNTRSGTTRTGRYLAQIGTEDGFAPDTAGAGAPLHYHAADTNRDARLSLIELTRVIELFNTRAGTARTGAYHVAPTTTEDGFAPGP